MASVTGFAPQGTYRQNILGRHYDVPNYFAPREGVDFSNKKTVLSDSVEEFAKKADDYARVLLGNEPKLERYRDTGSRFNPLSENCYIPFHKINLVFFLGGGGGTTVYVNNGHGERQRQDHTVAAVVLGVLALLAGAFATGLTYRKYNEAANKLNDNQAMVANINTWSQQLPQIPTTAKLKALSDKYMKLLERNYNNSWWNLAISIGVLAGGTFLAIGAVMGASALAIGGGALAVASIAVLLGRLGMSWGDRSVEDEAADLRSLWKQLKKPNHRTEKHETTDFTCIDVETYQQMKFSSPKYNYN